MYFHLPSNNAYAGSNMSGITIKLTCRGRCNGGDARKTVMWPRSGAATCSPSIVVGRHAQLLQKAGKIRSQYNDVRPLTPRLNVYPDDPGLTFLTALAVVEHEGRVAIRGNDDANVGIIPFGNEILATEFVVDALLAYAHDVVERHVVFGPSRAFGCGE